MLRSEFSEHVRAARCLLGCGLKTVSAAFERLPLRLVAFVGYTLIGFPEIYRLPSMPLASVSCVFGGVCIDCIFLFRSVGFGA